MAPFYAWGSTTSGVEPLREAVYFLPLGSQKFLVFILSTGNPSIFLIISLERKTQERLIVTPLCLYLYGCHSHNISSLKPET